MLEKPVELCLYGLQSDELARLKCLQKDYLETLFVKKAKLETWQKNILGGMDSFCMLVLLAASAIAISSGKMGVESVTAHPLCQYNGAIGAAVLGWKRVNR